MTLPSNVTAGIDALDRFAVQFQGLAELGATLRSIGSLEGMADAAEARKAAAEQALLDLGGQINAAKMNIDAATGQARDIVDEAKRKADAIGQDADAAVLVSVQKSEATAKGIIERAQEQAAALVDEGKRLRAVDDSAALLARSEVATLGSERDAIKAELDTLTQQLAAARDAVANLMTPK